MKEVKNRNISRRMLKTLSGVFLCCYLAFSPQQAEAQVSLNFQKWRSFQNKNQPAPISKTITNFALSPVVNVEKSRLLHVPVYTSTSKLPGIEKYRELGFFCKLDLRLDKTMYMPFRFRLGTLEYVNRKEGYWR